jgi:hypothetical protein
MRNVAVTFSKKQLSIEVKMILSSKCWGLMEARTNYISKYRRGETIEVTALQQLL